MPIRQADLTGRIIAYWVVSLLFAVFENYQHTEVDHFIRLLFSR
jgi:hypothetical protein